MRRLLPLLILAIGLLAFYVDFVPNAKFVVLDNINGGFAQPLQTLLGLDLKGGSAITYQALPANGQQPDSTAMEEIRTIMEDRVNSSGLTEAVVQTEQNNEVVVEVPGAADAQAVADLVGQTGNLEFVLLPPAQYGTGGSSGTTGSTAAPGGERDDRSYAAGPVHREPARPGRHRRPVRQHRTAGRSRSHSRARRPPISGPGPPRT